MKKNIVCYAAIIVCIVVVFTACDYYYLMMDGKQIVWDEIMPSIADGETESYAESAPLADTIRTLPFLVDKILMEVVSISTDSVQLRIENNSDMSIDVVPDYRRRRHQNYPGPFTSHGSFHIDFFDGQYWRLLTPYPNLAKYEDVFEYFIAYRVYPNEYLIFDYYLDLHPLPKQGIEHYRIVLDVLPANVTREMRQSLLDYRRAGGDIFFYTAGRPRHAIVAEFYWDWD